MHRRLFVAAAFTIACLVASLTPSFTAAGSALDGPGPRPEAVAGPPVSPLDADLILSITANVSLADPGDPVLLYAYARNLGNATATNVTVEAPLDPNSTYVWSFPNATYDPVNRTLQWTVASLAVGGRIDVVWTIRIAAGTPDNSTILCRFRASYQNATGAPLPPKMVVTTVRVRAPVFDPQLRPLRATAEHGDVVIAKLYANNTGSGTARQAWSNWTLGGNFQFAYLEENMPVTNVSDGFRVTWSNLAPGAHSLTAHLVVLRGMADGLSMTIQTQWTATDKNGNRLVPSTPTRSVDLLAPSFTLGMTASAVQLNTTSRFVLTLTVRNAGHAAGIGWLNTTLPSGPSFLSDNGSIPRSNQGRRYSWTTPSLAPGESLVLGMTFGSALDAGVASFVFMLEFTDGKGSPSASVSGPRIDIEFIAPATGTAPPAPTDLAAWALVAAAVAGGLVALAFLWRRRSSDVEIEDVFVAGMGGHLLAHRSSGLVPYEDEDILVGMFKVVQDFIHDAFAKGTTDQLGSLQVGQRKIIIERGRSHFIAVVYSGQDRGLLSERVRRVSRQIDHRFGMELENWSGDLDELRGLVALLPQIWKHQPRSRASVKPGPAARPVPRDPSAAREAQAKVDSSADPGGTELSVDSAK